MNHVIAKYSMICGADEPSMLRSTELRKQVVTYGATKDFDERKVGNLLEFLGHTDMVHRRSYQQWNMDRDMRKIEGIKKVSRSKKVL